MTYNRVSVYGTRASALFKRIDRLVDSNDLHSYVQHQFLLMKYLTCIKQYAGIKLKLIAYFPKDILKEKTYEREDQIRYIRTAECEENKNKPSIIIAYRFTFEHFV